MSAEVKEFEKPSPVAHEKFWQELAGDPQRLGYWKEIAVLWNVTPRPQNQKPRLVGEN